jgi:hypothetical protein
VAFFNVRLQTTKISIGTKWIKYFLFSLKFSIITDLTYKYNIGPKVRIVIFVGIFKLLKLNIIRLLVKLKQTIKNQIIMILSEMVLGFFVKIARIMKSDCTIPIYNICSIVYKSS